MRRVAGRQLWIGHAGDLRDARAVLEVGIGAVVELADGEPHAVLPRDLIRCRFPLSDDANNPPWLIRLAVRAVATMLEAGVPVLVCCSAGMSRSVCIASAGLALAERVTSNEALRIVVGSEPADVSPGFYSADEGSHWDLKKTLPGTESSSWIWDYPSPLCPIRDCALDTFTRLLSVKFFVQLSYKISLQHFQCPIF